jgi:molecular chaperone GrpE
MRGIVKRNLSMNDPKNDAAASADLPREAGGAGGESAEPQPETGLIEKLTAENAALKDRMLRTLAEMENLRRRTEREVADVRTYGVTRFAKDMLEFADNLARALATIPAEARAKAQGPFKALIEGAEVIERNFLATLGRHGVTKFEPHGMKFDPNMHEALFEVPNPAVPDGSVADVMEAGYAIGERVLRPAKVGVARGGPKAARSEETGTGEAS